MKIIKKSVKFISCFSKKKRIIFHVSIILLEVDVY